LVQERTKVGENLGAIGFNLYKEPYPISDLR